MTTEEFKRDVLKGKTASSEHSLQVQCVNWFRRFHPSIAYLLFAIPNGAFCGNHYGVKLVNEGLVSGVPDLCLAIARDGYHGLYIEMKNGTAGKVADHQKIMMARLTEQGYLCAVCRSLYEFQDVIVKYLHDK